ncbi:hypothetical protein [Aeromonas popoffii]|uniref:hypothetical protein n=1 Tax=Aeromonas popoffii TaxID=70856 RepID=UPI0005AADA8B|nr:hypothetical protein [Aeromonas popoffii]
MRSYQEITRAISVRWIIRKTLRAVIYCVNPLNFFKVLLRLIKWFLYFVFGAVAIGMLTLAVGNYATAAEWTAATKPTTFGTCKDPSNRVLGSPVTIADCAKLVTKYQDNPNRICSVPAVEPSAGQTVAIMCTNKPYTDFGGGGFWNDKLAQATYTCPPAGKPEFTFGPKVTENGTVCEKKPVQCLLGSVKDTNTITGKEFCRPICQGIAGNTYGEPLTPVKYFQSNFGSVQIQCYGQCSIRPVGGSVSVDPNLKIWAAVIQFTGENCPIQTQGTEEETSTAGANTPVTPPNSSASTDAAQNQLQNAASSAVSNPTSGATGTATLNTVVDKLAETSNKEIKANSEQNAALGNVIQQTARDIQTSIKEAQLSASQGGSGAGIGQIQMANAIKDGNASMGTKLDGIKDAIEDSKDDNQGPLPPGDSTIKTNPADVNPHPNDWASRNYNTVMQQHVAAMNALPLFSGISGFFRVEMGAGTCPSFSIDVPQIAGVGGGSIVFDVFCNADLQRIFEIIALCVKLLGLYVAFRIALLD